MTLNSKVLPARCSNSVHLFREVFELFNDACSRAMQCGEDLSIDETLFASRYVFTFLWFLLTSVKIVKSR
jgi:hypothetical protein